VVPVLKEILAINSRISIIASPWSAPSWMKTNGLPKAGSLKLEDYDIYAQYFVRYLHAMASEGIPIRAITMQNEPLNANNTPSMVMTATEEAAFLANALGPELHKAGLTTEVILYDHNCDRPDYPLTILADPKASPYAAGSGFHLYGGSITAMTQVHDAYPAKNLYFTEQMVTQKDNTAPLKLANAVSRLIVGAPRNWSRNVLLWNLAADPQDNPHTGNGGCPVCQGAITLDGDQMTRNLAFYTVAHAAKFVRPGSIRIASDNSDLASLPNVAYSTPNHSIVLIVVNPGTVEQSFHVAIHDRSFAATLSAGDVATYVWR
jgi:glucosylceramidase